MVRTAVTREMFAARYADVFKGDPNWQAIKVSGGRTYDWPMSSTYVKNPPYFEGMSMTPAPITDVSEARILALFGDSITTDHISPAGNIKKASPAGKYLSEHQVAQDDFNSYGARRGNHEVMMRGTFANIRIKNAMVKDDAGNAVEGGFTLHQPSGERMAIYDAAMRYQSEKRELVIFAGKEYGTGSSRDWAAKGTQPAGRARGGRRELRAHPPLQPDRHGRAAAAIRRRPELGGPRADRARRRSPSMASPPSGPASASPCASPALAGFARPACSAGSTPKTRSNTSATAVFSIMCCAGSPRSVCVSGAP